MYLNPLPNKGFLIRISHFCHKNLESTENIIKYTHLVMFYYMHYN